MKAKKTWQLDCQVSNFCFRLPLTGVVWLALCCLSVALDKPVYPTFGVNNFLLSCVEGMAGAANFNTDVRFGGTGQDFCAADACSLDVLILGVNALFHVYISTRFLGPERESRSLAVNPDVLAGSKLSSGLEESRSA